MKERWTTGNNVEVIDKDSPHFKEKGILTKPKQVPVYGKLEYHWFVKIGDNELLFSPKQLKNLKSA